MLDQLLALGLRPHAVAGLAVLVGAVVRALRSRLKPAVLPWLAFALGLLGGVSSVATDGLTAGGAVRGAFEGLLAGALAVAGKSSLGPVLGAIAPGLAAAVFGRSKK